MQAQWRPHGDVVPDVDVERRRHGAAREEVGPSAVLDYDGGVDQRDPRRILGGRCPRRRSISISPGARGCCGSGGAARVRIS